MEKPEKNKRFRMLETSSGKLALAGRDAEQNEKLVEQAGKDEIVLHTSAAGSPFVNIKKKNNKEKATQKDIKEAAVFCARHSRDWKKNKGNVKVHVFKGRDIYKEKGMKTGTFGVKKFKSIIVKKEEIEELEKNARQKEI